VGRIGSDGKAYTPAEQERLTRALFSLSEAVYRFPPARLDQPLLQDWQARLSDHHPRMQPGQLRDTDITFGSYYGTAPRDIPAQLSALITEVNTRLDRLEELLPEQNPEREDVVRLAVFLHAELVRIHPFWDGNGRLARLAHLWIHALFLLPVPIWPDVHRDYFDALGRHLRHQDDRLLVTLTLQGMDDDPNG